MGTQEKSSKPEAYVSKAVSYSICTAHRELYRVEKSYKNKPMLYLAKRLYFLNVSNVKKLIPLIRKDNIL